MNDALDWSLWRPSFVTIAIGATFIFVTAFIIQKWVTAMTWRRTLWQIAFLSIGLLALGELSGTGRMAMNWTRTTSPAPDKFETRVEAKILDEPSPQLLAAALLSKASPATSTFEVPPKKPTTVWWPAIIWLTGTSFVLGWILILRLGFWSLVPRRNVRDEALLARVDSIARRLSLSRQVRVTEVRRITGPIAHGVLRPGISLPAGFGSYYSVEQQNVMLAHELAHLAARDPLWHTLVDIVMSLVWWHPFAWLARHELHSATEAAADEASLLIENGPATLAECLVKLGNHLSRRRSLGRLGIEGGGFRSVLGNRVKRLLAEENRTWNPPPPYRVGLIRIACPLALAALILAATVWAQPTIAGPTTLRGAFRQSVLGVMLTVALPTPQQSTEVRNQTEEVLPPPAPPKSTNEYVIQAGDTLTRLVSTFRDRGQPMTLKLLQEANPDVQWNRLRIGQRIVIPEAKTSNNDNRRKILNEKLDSILIEEISLDGGTLSQAIEKLGRIVKERDPDGKGLNFIINQAQSKIDPSTGLPVHHLSELNREHPKNQPDLLSAFPKDAKQAPPKPVTIRALGLLRNVTLRDTLDAIAGAASTPIRYSVEAYAIVLSSEPSAPAMHTRFFKIDSETFERALLSRAKTSLDQAISNAVQVSRAIDIPPGSYTPLTAPRVAPTLTRSEMLLADTRRYFAQLGVDFSAPGRQLVYSDTRGQLMVRATLEELDIIEQAIGDLTTPPPQVVIEASVYEITKEDAKALGLEWILGNEFTNLFPTIRKLDLWNPSSLFNPTRSQNTNYIQATGILTEAQHRAFREVIDRRGLTNLLNAPRMTMLSGRQGQFFKQVRVRHIVTDMDWSSTITSLTNPPQAQPIAEQFELGPVIDVVPHVQADGKTIELTTIPTLTEFIGYDLDERARRKIVTTQDGRKEIVMSNQPSPIFRKLQMVSSAIVRDGQTVVLAGGSEQFLANPKRNAPLPKGTKIPGEIKRTSLLIFVTPTLVDPAGNRIHKPEDIPPGIPAQPAALPQK